MDATEVTVERAPAASARALLALTKPKQTVLLLVTGVGGYALTVPGAWSWPTLLAGAAALWASVSGCTALNMVLDRDIDARMERTADRPLPTGEVSPAIAWAFGGFLSAAGLAVAWSLGAAFGAAVTAGFAIDLLVYTAWLKRKTPWSILIGGLAGGMPALAGRTLALGSVDTVAALLALGVVLWIPAHILTLAMRRADEFRSAGVPVWPTVYGRAATRRLIAVSTVACSAVLLGAGVLLHAHVVALGILAVLGAALSGLAVAGLFRPSDGHDLIVFKSASIYMAAAFGCLVVGAASA